MAFEDLFVALRDDQFSKLWGEEPLQAANATQLFNLLGHPRLKSTVQLRHFVGALTQLA